MTCEDFKDQVNILKVYASSEWMILSNLTYKEFNLCVCGCMECLSGTKFNLSVLLYQSKKAMVSTVEP